MRAERDINLRNLTFPIAPDGTPSSASQRLSVPGSERSCLTCGRVYTARLSSQYATRGKAVFFKTALYHRTWTIVRKTVMGGFRASDQAVSLDFGGGVKGYGGSVRPCH